MGELTDLELQVEVAKINLGSGFDIHKNERLETVGYLPVDCIGKLTPFNPITDDGLCFRLMVKYKIDFFHVNRIFCASDNESVTVQSDSPNRAVLLAIMEANKS